MNRRAGPNAWRRRPACVFERDGSPESHRAEREQDAQAGRPCHTPLHAPLRGVARGRRGFALVLALGMLAMMLTFLIAAQTSVMMSHRNARRSAERSSASELRARALSLAARRVGEGAPESLPAVEVAGVASGRAPSAGSVAAPPIARAAHHPLASDDPLYAQTPGLAFREGDALVVVSSGEGEERAYVVNGAGRRRGAVRVR